MFRCSPLRGPVREAHPDLDTEARNRADRLNRATTQEMQTALAFLRMIDPGAFEIAFQAVPPVRTLSLTTATPSRSASAAAARPRSSPTRG
jgi:hypothetical protein